VNAAIPVCTLLANAEEVGGAVTIPVSMVPIDAVPVICVTGTAVGSISMPRLIRGKVSKKYCICPD
jgi:hypothetical protein